MANYKEALALAGVELILWRQAHEEARESGANLINMDGTPGYYHEPMVRLSGHDVLISEIAERASSLTGPLPILVERIFDAIIDPWASGLEISTYPEAAEALQIAIKEELNKQASHPLPGPSVRDIVRKDERERVCKIIEKAVVATSDDQCSEAPRLTRGQWRALLAKLEPVRS